MSKITVPAGYRSVLDIYDTQKAIETLKRTFEQKLCLALNLTRVSAPLFVDPASGMNDDLSGVERAVVFDIKDTDKEAAIVHSLAKWKRVALRDYGFSAGEGLYTDMNAIRRDEEMDNLHSVYTDQWDWEKIITRESRNVDYLKLIVSAIVDALYNTNNRLKVHFPQLHTNITREVKFITSQELEDMYPGMTPVERENAITREYGTVFIMQIGGVLRSGKPHGTRAPDYDDWQLNGDILVWNEVLDSALEISSMGIRVDAESLARQLDISGCNYRRELPFHKMLLNDELPLTIGGGIGQSRLCMLLMGCAHIGEVQSSIWDAETVKACADSGIRLL